MKARRAVPETKGTVRETKREVKRGGKRGRREETHELVSLVVVVLLVPIDPFSVHVRRLAPDEGLERPLEHRRPREVAFGLVLDALVRPVEVVKVPLVLTPLVTLLLRCAGWRRWLELSALAWSSRRRTRAGPTRCCDGDGGGGIGGELGGEETTASDTFRRREAGAEVGEVAVLIEGDPPGRGREGSVRTQREEVTTEAHQKLWK